jgi:hypothetical protein
VSPDAIGDAPSITLIAGGNPSIYRTYTPRAIGPVQGQLRVNPLYRVDRSGDLLDLTLAFPTEEYAEEFGESRRYLADRLTLPAELSPSALGAEYESLRRRRMVLDLPPHYL